MVRIPHCRICLQSNICKELELDEEGTRISLTIVDTPGFGDQIDNEARFAYPALVYLFNFLFMALTFLTTASQRLWVTLNDNMMTSWPKNRASSVTQGFEITGYTPYSTSLHQLDTGEFGLISLTIFILIGFQRLRELDIELMKRLSPRVNVIPVIGKADSLTPAELAESKKLVMEDIEHYRIPVYNFPYDIEEDDEDTVEENAELRGLMPFAIVGSEDIVEIGGRRVRARQYPWGVVEIDNPRHSDFLAIRSALLHSHLADLKEITHDFLYENYRTEKLSKSVEGGAAA